MGFKAFLVKVVRENRDGTDRQQLIAKLQTGEEVFLYAAGTTRNPDRIAILNHNESILGFLDVDLAYAIRQNTHDIESLRAYVYRVIRESDGTFQCEIDLDVPDDSPIATMYSAVGDAPMWHETQRKRTFASSIAERRPPHKKQNNRPPRIVVLLVSVVVLCVGVFALTRPQSTTLPASSFSPTAEEYVLSFADAGFPIDDIIIYTEETDENEKLGRPGQYTSKVNFADTRVEQFSYLGPQGGTIEVFENRADMESRKAYIENVYQSGVLPQQEYIYPSDNGLALLRVSFSLVPSKAQEYEAAMNQFARREAILPPTLETVAVHATPPLALPTIEPAKLSGIPAAGKMTSGTPRPTATGRLTVSSLDWDKLNAEWKKAVTNTQHYPFVYDVHAEVSDTGTRINIMAIVYSETSSSVVLDYADTLIRQLNLFANMQVSSIALGSKDYYGGLYDNYSLLIAIAPLDKVDASTDEWYMYHSVPKGTHTKRAPRLK